MTPEQKAFDLINLFILKAPAILCAYQCRNISAPSCDKFNDYYGSLRYDQTQIFWDEVIKFMSES